MAYYSRERLIHTLTPKIEFETRKWDKAYHYLNNYFRQTTPTEYQTGGKGVDQARTMTAPNDQCVPTETVSNQQEEFRPAQTECNGFDSKDSDTCNSTTYQNCFRKIKKMQNTYHIPNYAGYVPGMKTQNPFGRTFTKASKEEIEHFNNRRENKNYDIMLSKKWNYDPLSRTYGEFVKEKDNYYASRLQKTIINHPYTLRVRATSFNTGTDWKTPEVFNKRLFQTGRSFYQAGTKDYTFSLPKFCRPTTVPNK